MSDDNWNNEMVDRRAFLKTSVLSGAGLAAVSLTGCSQPATCSGQSALPEEWDIEFDVVVAGCGSAGSAAAIEVVESGGSAVILEKQNEKWAGGDTSQNGGLLFKPATDIEVMRISSFGDMDVRRARSLHEETKKVGPWLLENGATFLPVDYVPGTEPPPPSEADQPEADSPYGRFVRGGGWEVYQAIKRGREKAGVPIHYETPVRRLLINHDTGEVVGVEASQQGKPMYAKARKAVVIATGSYTANRALVQDFHLPGVDYQSHGSPYNQGDGLIFGAEAGVALTDMAKGLEFGEVVFKNASEEMGCGVPMRTTGALHDSRIIINKDGRRIMDERHDLQHFKGNIAFLDFAGSVVQGFAGKHSYTNLPIYMICDRARIESGPLGFHHEYHTWGRARQLYQWSTSNQQEIERGWLYKSETLEQLAKKLTYTDVYGDTLTVGTDALRRGVEKYNSQCTRGEDGEFGRPADTLQPILKPPFFAAEMQPGVIYTIGGLKSNLHGQALNWRNQPIPRLYAAGNVGQGVHLMPIGFGGCFAAGKLAAEHAMTLEAWDKV